MSTNDIETFRPRGEIKISQTFDFRDRSQN